MAVRSDILVWLNGEGSFSGNNYSLAASEYVTGGTAARTATGFTVSTSSPIIGTSSFDSDASGAEFRIPVTAADNVPNFSSKGQAAVYYKQKTGTWVGGDAVIQFVKDANNDFKVRTTTTPNSIGVTDFSLNGSNQIGTAIAPDVTLVTGTAYFVIVGWDLTGATKHVKVGIYDTSGNAITPNSGSNPVDNTTAFTGWAWDTTGMYFGPAWDANSDTGSKWDNLMVSNSYTENLLTVMNNTSFPTAPEVVDIPTTAADNLNA